MGVIHLPQSVVLTRDQIGEAITLGRARYRNDRNASIKNRRIGETSDEEKEDIYAVGAEIAAATLLGVEHDRTTEPRAGSVDLTLPSGLTVDVKRPRSPSGRLFYPRYKWEEHARDTGDFADICLLVHGPVRVDQMATFTVRGWVWTRVLCHPDNLSCFQRRTELTYIVEHENLMEKLPLFVEPPGRPTGPIPTRSTCVTLDTPDVLDNLLEETIQE